MISAFVATFNGFYERIFRHDLLQPRRRILFVRVQCRMVQRFLPLPLYHQPVESVRLKQLLHLAAFFPAVHKAYLYLKILFRPKQLAVHMEQALHRDQYDRCARRYDVQPRSCRHSHPRRRPYARGGRQPVYFMLTVNDDART